MKKALIILIMLSSIILLPGCKKAGGGNSTYQSGSNTTTVYITNTGSKYHASGCRYLRKSCISISKDDAIKRGYSPCSVCNP